MELQQEPRSDFKVLFENAERTRNAANLLSLMGNPRRLRILVLLSRDEMNVGELVKRMDIDQSALSQHLAKLRVGGLVKTRRNAQQIFYRCDCEKVESVLKTLSELDLFILDQPTGSTFVETLLQ